MFSETCVTAESGTDPVAVKFLWQWFTYWSSLPWQVHLFSNNILVQQSKEVHRDVHVCGSLTSHQLVKGQDLEAEREQSKGFLTTECCQWMHQSEIPINDSVSCYSFGLRKVRGLQGCACAAEAQLTEYTSGLSVALFCKHRTDPQLVWELREQPSNSTWHPTAKIFISQNLGLLVKEYSHEDSGVDN